MWTIDGRKALSRRAMEMWSTGNDDDPTEIFASNYINHQEPAAAGGVTGLGLKAWQAVVESHRRAFSPSKVEVLLQIAENDFVATHWRFTVTNTAPYLGHPPTNKEASWTGVQIDRFATGKIAESWVSWDKFTQLEGLGLVD